MAEQEKVLNEQVKEVKAETKNEAPRGRKPFNKNGRRPLRERKQDEFEDRTVAVNRVVKTVKGGRHMRFAALVVIGDGKGNVIAKIGVTFSCWTCWNETTQSMNFGHYGLTYEECDSVLKEHFHRISGENVID